jgi:hypothetical protein
MGQGRDVQPQEVANVAGDDGEHVAIGGGGDHRVLDQIVGTARH